MEKRQETRELISGDQLVWAVALVKRSFRHLWKAAIICIIGGLLSVGFALAKKRIYLSEAVILYRQVIDSSAISNTTDEQRITSKEIGMRLRELLLSRPRLKKIIDKHKLYPKIVEANGYVEAVDRFRGKIEYRVGAGDTFHISFRGPTPELAQKVTAELANSLIAQDTSMRKEQAKATVNFLKAETKRSQQILQVKEKKLAQFLASHPEFAQEVQGASGLAAGASIRAERRRLKQGDPILRALERQAARIRAQLGSGGGASLGPGDPKVGAALQGAEEELREAQRNLSKKRNSFTEKHPDVRSAKTRASAAAKRVANLKAAYSRSRKRRVAKPVDKDRLRRELGNIKVQLAEHKKAKKSGTKKQSSKANSIVVLETEWQRFNRDVREARDRYIRLETRQFKAALSASSEVSVQSSQMRIIDPAFEPTRPSGMGRSIIVAAGTAVSMAVAAFLMLVLALLDHRVYNRLDVERPGITDVLIEVPRATRQDRKQEKVFLKAAAKKG